MGGKGSTQAAVVSAHAVAHLPAPGRPAPSGVQLHLVQEAPQPIAPAVGAAAPQLDDGVRQLSRLGQLDQLGGGAAAERHKVLKDDAFHFLPANPSMRAPRWCVVSAAIGPTVGAFDWTNRISGSGCL